MSGIDYPVAIKDIGKFESQNPISINVFAINEKKLVFPVRITEEKKEKHVNLLYISNQTNSHYVLIKSMSRLLAGQLNHHNPKTHICDYCLHGCTSARVLEKHEERCKEHRAQLVKYPPPGTTLKFTKYEHQLQLPFYIVGDLETIQESIQTVLPNPEKSSTTKTTNHVPCSAGYMIVSSDSNYYKQPVIFKGKQCISEFLDSLKRDVSELKDVLRHPIKMNLSDEEEVSFQNATTCHICGKEATEEDSFVHDHDHLTGFYRGAAHNSCNLNYRINPDKMKIPIFFHNLKGYDSHLILQHVNPKKHGRISCIPSTSEKYVSFTIGDIVFKDSLSFTNKALSELVSTLKPEQLKKTKQYLEYCASKQDQAGPKRKKSLDNTSRKRMKMNDIDEDVQHEPCLKRKSSFTSNTPTKKMKMDNFIIDEADASDLDENDRELLDELYVSSSDEESDDFIDDADMSDEDCSFYSTVNRKMNEPKYYEFEDLPTNDYRHNPFLPPTLDEEQRKEVDKKFKLLQQKGIYPYEYIDNLVKLDEQNLPSRESFYSSLDDEYISEESYQRAYLVWKTFDMKSMWDYHDLYLKTDILLLADVLHSFQEMCIKYYNIDPLHSYTAPGFAWQAALKMTDVELELLSDKDMYTFCEAAKRGGVSVISHRYAQSNIPDTDGYDPHLPTKHLVYLDANNLYGWAMCQYLPTHGFRFLSQREIENLDICALSDTSEDGYLLEVDLGYPTHLHNLHSEYPLGPEKVNVTEDMLSPYQKNLLLAMKGKNSKGKLTKIEKLIPNLNEKKKYIVHHRVLKQYIELGLVVEKVHRVLTFKQQPWLKKYIDFNTNMRAAAKSDFEKDFFKLLNNSVFGKTMEDVRNHRHIDLVDSEKKALRLSAQPTFRSFNIFHENLFAVERYKSLVELNKPIYTGVSVLDLSKYLMYDFHYGYIKQRYPGNKSLLCFTDTDSLLYQIETPDVHKDMVEDHHLFDLSDFSNDHPCFEGMDAATIKELKMSNKKVVGKFKDELKGNRMLEFIGLRAKAYSYLYEKEIYIEIDEDGKETEVYIITDSCITKLSMEEVQKLKGIKKSVVKKVINHDHYRKCLFEGEPHYETMKSFRSSNHHISTITQRKLALSRYDDKRYIMDDGITTLAHGHNNINSI